MILGFTGTREQPTEAQLEWLARRMCDADVTRLHHGACVGADRAAHEAALACKVPITVHPPKDTKLMMRLDRYRRPTKVHVMPAKDYHTRDRDIVNSVDFLLALPDGPRRPHSGTWYTIDYAAENNVPGLICYPDGTVEPIGSAQ